MKARPSVTDRIRSELSKHIENIAKVALYEHGLDEVWRGLDVKVETDLPFGPTRVSLRLELALSWWRLLWFSPSMLVDSIRRLHALTEFKSFELSVHVQVRRP